MNITTEIGYIQQRINKAATALTTIEHQLNIQEALALTGVRLNDPNRTGDATAPDNQTEPPTGHTDPTGDNATTNHTNNIRKKRTAITDALHGIDKAIDHLERTAHAAANTTTQQPKPPDTNTLCTAHGCNRIKEPGRQHCLEDNHALQNLERKQAAPTCTQCHQRPVETYTTTNGHTAYRHMHYDAADSQWHQSTEIPPTCGACRKRNERTTT